MERVFVSFSYDLWPVKCVHSLFHNPLYIYTVYTIFNACGGFVFGQTGVCKLPISMRLHFFSFYTIQLMNGNVHRESGKARRQD